MKKKIVFSTTPLLNNRNTNSLSKNKINKSESNSTNRKPTLLSRPHQNNLFSINKSNPKLKSEISKDVNLFKYLADVKNLFGGEIERSNRNNSDLSNEPDHNSKTYENLISKMFNYLEGKVSTKICDDLKIILSEELRNQIAQNSTRNNVNEVINLITKNSRNLKSEILNLEKGEINDDMHSNEGERNKYNLKPNNNVGFSSQGITQNSTNTSTHNAKNLKLSFDFTGANMVGSLEKNMNSLNKNDEAKIINANSIPSVNSNISKNKNQTPKGSLGVGINITKEISNRALNYTSNNNKNSSYLNSNINANLGTNFSNLNNRNNTGKIVSQNLDNKLKINSLNNIISSKKTNHTNLLKNFSKNTNSNIGRISGGRENNSLNIENLKSFGSVTSNTNKFKSLMSKAEAKSVSKSKEYTNYNPVDSRSVMTSLSISKSKSKIKLNNSKATLQALMKSQAINLNSKANFNSNSSSNSQNVFKNNILSANQSSHQNGYLKLNANLTKRMGISPESVRNGCNSNNIRKNVNFQPILLTNLENGENKFKQNKNINLSIQSPSENAVNSYSKKLLTNIQSNKLNKPINKQHENSLNNIKQNNTFNNEANIVKKLNQFNEVNQANQAIKANKTLCSPVDRGTLLPNSNYYSNNTTKRANLNNENASTNININDKHLLPAASKNIMDMTYSVGAREKSHQALAKAINLNEMNNPTIDTTQNLADFIQVQGESRKEASNKLINDIKLNLDDNLRGMFNFSYENFHNDQTESAHSTKKSEDFSDDDSRLQNEFRPENLFKSLKKDLNFPNEISYDENEEKLKSLVFKK